MRCGLWVLLLTLGVAFAQEAEDDDEDLVIDDVPKSSPEEEKAADRPPTYPPAREDGKRPRSVAVRKGPFTLSLPADWVVREFDAAKAAAGWDVWLPGAKALARLQIFRGETFTDPRVAPWNMRESLKASSGIEIEVLTEPVPAITVRRADLAWMHAYRAVRNNLFTLELQCPPENFDQAAADLLAGAKSFKADVELWPPVPEGYESKQKGPWLIARHPDVKGSLALLEKELKAEEKRFRHTHGSLPKGDAPLVVLVHASDGDAAGIDPAVKEHLRHGFYADLQHRRLFAVLPAKDDLEQLASLAEEAHDLLFLARYGDLQPYWLCIGDGLVDRAEVVTGTDLPELCESWVNAWKDLDLHRTDEMEAQVEARAEKWGTEAFYYAAMFREGRFRKEYKAYLDDFSETGDGQGAYDRHLKPLDPDEVRKAVEEYYLKLKSVHHKESK